MSVLSLARPSVQQRDATYMFTLRRVTALDIAQRRIRFHDTRADQVVQAQEVLIMAHAVKIPPAERQGTKVLGDGAEQRLC